MYRVIFVVLFFVAACSENPMTSSPTDLNPAVDTQARPVVIQQNNALALLTLNQGYNDLGRYVVEGRIKNLLYDDDITSITIRVTLYTTSGTSIDEENETIYRMYPRAEGTFKTESWPFELGRLTPDPNETVITMLIDGVIVAYEDRRGGSGSDTAGRYDFRWSRWGDGKDEVQVQEPGLITFTMEEGMVEIGRTTTTLSLTEAVAESVSVHYDFMGNELFAGTYRFRPGLPNNRITTLKALLGDRYGLSFSEGNITYWKRNEQTWVALYPATGDIPVRVVYVEESMLLHFEGNLEYNRLPLRVVVPD